MSEWLIILGLVKCKLCTTVQKLTHQHNCAVEARLTDLRFCSIVQLCHLSKVVSRALIALCALCIVEQSICSVSRAVYPRVSRAVCEVLREHQALALSSASSSPICTASVHKACIQCAQNAKSVHKMPVNARACAKIAQMILHGLHKWCAHCTNCTRHYPSPPVAITDPEDSSKYSSLITQYNTIQRCTESSS